MTKQTWELQRELIMAEAKETITLDYCQRLINTANLVGFNQDGKCWAEMDTNEAMAIALYNNKVAKGIEPEAALKFMMNHLKNMTSSAACEEANIFPY
jgi:hypothetical protein